MDAPLLLLLLLLLLLMLSAADAQLLIPLRKELPRFASLQLGRVSRKPSTGNFISLTRIFLPALRTNWRFRTQHGRSTCPNLEAGNSVRTREKKGRFHQMPRGLFLSGSGSSRALKDARGDSANQIPSADKQLQPPITGSPCVTVAK